MGSVIEDRKGQTLLLIAVAMGMFMDGLDGSIVNVALPAITASYGIDTSAASWIVTIYFLVMAGLILIFGRISDKGAIKKVFMFGFLLFSIGSLLCALSPSIGVLLASRVVQGVGAAMLAASALMLCVKYFPPHRMGYGLAIGVLGSSVGAALGPALGGVLTEIGSWHWIFIINIPVGIIALIFAKKVIPPDEGLVKSDFDIKGSIMLFISLFAGLFTLETVPSEGFTVVSIIAFIVFLILFPIFIVYELKLKNPLLNLRLFKSMRFNAVVISFVLLNVVYMGTLYLLPFYLNIEMEANSLVSGGYLLVPAIVTLLFCSYFSKLSDRTERRKFVIAACACLIAFTAIFSIITPEMSIIFLFTALICMGLVWALCGGPAAGRIVENVPEEEKGSGSSFMSFFIYFGSALGTTVFSVLFKVGSPGSTVISEMTKTDFLEGFHFVMLIAVVIGVVALIFSAIVNEKKSKRDV